MPIRLCKASLIAAIALLMTLVAFNNITDYDDNWMFVQHVMGMDTIFPHSTELWRAVTFSPVQRIAYLAIILVEAVSAFLLILASAALVRSAKSAPDFERAVPLAALGLTSALLLYGAGFLAVGGEWFLMWQSKSWGGSDAAARFFLVIAAVLVVMLTGREATDSATPQ